MTKEIYEKLNGTFEKWSKIFYFVFVYISVPANLVPSLVITTFNYLTTDSREDALQLPFPAS